MTEERLVLAELLEKAGDGDFLRAVAEAVLQLHRPNHASQCSGCGSPVRWRLPGQVSVLPYFEPD
jgi:hypothetical protein